MITEAEFREASKKYAMSFGFPEDDPRVVDILSESSLIWNWNYYRVKPAAYKFMFDRLKALC